MLFFLSQAPSEDTGPGPAPVQADQEAPTRVLASFIMAPFEEMDSEQDVTYPVHGNSSVAITTGGVRYFFVVPRNLCPLIVDVVQRMGTHRKNLTWQPGHVLPPAQQTSLRTSLEHDIRFLRPYLAVRAPPEIIEKFEYYLRLVTDPCPRDLTWVDYVNLDPGMNSAPFTNVRPARRE